jgi:uncharacterized membrane protein YheB (UPF0754 family)
MNFLLSLIFLPLNLLFGASIIWLIRWLLFNKKQRYIFKKKNILTPGLIPKLKNYVLRKVQNAVKDYYEQVDDFESHQGYIYNWEKKVYHKVFDATEFIDNIRYMPTSVADWFRHALAFIAKDLSSRFLRTFIPYLYEYYKIDNKIDLVAEKIDLVVIESYYNQYCHRFLMYFNLLIFFIAGILNQILFLIIV